MAAQRGGAGGGKGMGESISGALEAASGSEHRQVIGKLSGG